MVSNKNLIPVSVTGEPGETYWIQLFSSQLKDGFSIETLKIHTSHLLSEKLPMPTISSHRSFFFNNNIQYGHGQL